eukprot:2867117-Rhodomonas_salina.2
MERARTLAQRSDSDTPTHSHRDCPHADLEAEAHALGQAGWCQWLALTSRGRPHTRPRHG